MFDLDADLVLYDTQTRRMFTDSLVYTRDYMETFPAWSPDGTTLYFCRAAAYAPAMPLDSIRYDLYRIRFDEKEERLYDLECVYQASAFGRSVSFPRVSPDGRYLMFTQFDYGNFSIWHPFRPSLTTARRAKPSSSKAISFSKTARSCSALPVGGNEDSDGPGTNAPDRR